MILLINTCQHALSEAEFVLPVVRIVRSFDAYIVKRYDKITPADIETANHIIICGTSLADNKALHEMGHFSWINETRTPLLGICIGMEIIAKAYDCTLVKKLEIGMTPVVVGERNKVILEDTAAYCLHQYCVDEDGLGDFYIYGRSRECAQIIKHRRKEAYGVLFHPEVRNPDVIAHFLAITNQSQG